MKGWKNVCHHNNNNNNNNNKKAKHWFGVDDATEFSHQPRCYIHSSLLRKNALQMSTKLEHKYFTQTCANETQEILSYPTRAA